MTKDMKKFLTLLIVFLGTIFWLPVFYKLYKNFELLKFASNAHNLPITFFIIGLLITVVFLALIIFILQRSFSSRWLFLPIIVGGYTWLLSLLFLYNHSSNTPVAFIISSLKDFQLSPETNKMFIAKNAWSCSVISYNSSAAILGIIFGVVIIAFIFSIIGICKSKNVSPDNSNDTTTNF